MTVATGSNSAVSSGVEAPSGWRELRDDGDIQFAPVEFPEPEPREPTWLDRFFEWLAELIEPLGRLFGGAWPVIQWILLALAAAAVLFLIWRLVGPMAGNYEEGVYEEEDDLWVPDEAESLALLEDADRLATEGRFDEATHLLLKRSVGQIAAARPDWVEPSSTARELAALPALSDGARGAFRTIAERVERSLFALRSLDKADWEAARQAYAEFALVKFERAGIDRTRAIEGTA